MDIDYNYGVNKEGKRFIIIKVGEDRFLIFETVEDIFEFMDKNNCSQTDYKKTIDYANKVFRAEEDVFAEKFLNNRVKDVDYIS